MKFFSGLLSLHRKKTNFRIFLGAMVFAVSRHLLKLYIQTLIMSTVYISHTDASILLFGLDL